MYVLQCHLFLILSDVVMTTKVNLQILQEISSDSQRKYIRTLLKKQR